MDPASASASLRPLDELPPDEARRLRGLFCDIDDTLTHGGKLVPAAYAALCDAVAAGLRVVPVTGRPCGWAEVLSALWPVDAVIGEGGAGAVRDGGDWLWWDDDATRRAQRARLDALAAHVAARLPWARPARDHLLRRVDAAWDIGEHYHAAPDEQAALAALIAEHGARVQVSTVHMHAVYGSYDKAEMAVRLAAARWGETRDDLRDGYLFVGDSPNDQAGFAFFRLTAGVANVARYADRLHPPPRYVATQQGGHGFAEILEKVLSLRRSKLL